MVEKKSEIETFLQDAIRDWELNYKKFYHRDDTPENYHYDKSEKEKYIAELGKKHYSVIDPVSMGWIQGIIDALEWVLQIPEDQGTTYNIYIKQEYRKFVQCIPVKQEE